MCGLTEKAIYEYFNKTYSNKELILTLGCNTLLAKELNEEIYYIIQRCGSREIYTKLNSRELAFERFNEILLEK